MAKKPAAKRYEVFSFLGYLERMKLFTTAQLDNLWCAYLYDDALRSRDAPPAPKPRKKRGAK